MKRIIFLVAALLAVFSGIAAVTAYEGHTVDIKAHVENAIGVETYELCFGAVFPEERVQVQLSFGLSESFMAATRVSSLGYSLFWELKPIPVDADVLDPNDDGYYTALNPYLNVSAEVATIDPVASATIPGIGQAVKFGEGILWKNMSNAAGGETCEVLHFAMDVPVFEGYWQQLTDPIQWDPDLVIPTGSFVLETETICGNISVQVPHADLGSNLKIQVTGIYSEAN